MGIKNRFLEIGKKLNNLENKKGSKVLEINEKVTIDTEKINSEPEEIDSKSKNMSILVLEI